MLRVRRKHWEHAGRAGRFLGSKRASDARLNWEGRAEWSGGRLEAAWRPLQSPAYAARRIWVSVSRVRMVLDGGVTRITHGLIQVSLF